MNCPTCGREYALGARFCSACGQLLTTPSEERRVVTVVFADLVGFTSLSEQLDPEQVKGIVDAAFERLVRDVTAFGGRIDKIIGDAIVALFGAPVAHEDDAERAVRSALRMQETLGAYAAESGVDIRMRVGVNTGEVLVGGLRAGGDYTAMGDVVNTASRLQTLAAPSEVLVGEATHSATEQVIDYESRGGLIARGREEPVQVWVARAALLPPGYRPRTRQSPLVGRESEMSTLTNAVRMSVNHGRALLVVLLGEAGVGKTRVAQELGAMAKDEADMAVFVGRCVPYGEANPWWPISEALRSGTGVGRGDSLEAARDRTTTAVRRVGAGDTADAESDVVAGLLHLMGYEGPLRALDGARSRLEASQALLTFVEASARHRPLMVRLTDLHWADQAVLDLIDELFDQLARLPLVFVATGRTGLQERWTPQSGRFNAVVVNLDPLDRSSSTLLLDTLSGTDIDEATRNVLLDRSGGNPLYLEELVSVISQQSASDVVTGMASSAAELPDTLRGLVAARIDGLTAAEQCVVEDASVWGSSGPILALERLAENIRSEGHRVPALVNSLVDKDVMALDGSDWSFRSNVVREVAYSRLTKRDRLMRHYGIASYLERVKDTHDADEGVVEIIARHSFEAACLSRELGLGAGRHDQHELAEMAMTWVSEAARRAENTAAWPTARHLYTQALEVSADHQQAERFACLLGRSRAYLEERDFDGAHDDGVAALALAEAMDDPRSISAALVRVGVADVRAGRHVRGDEELSAAVELSDQYGDTSGRAEALRQRGMTYLLLGDQRSAVVPIKAALEAFREVGDKRGEAWAQQNLAWIALSDGRVDLAQEHIEASIAAFRELGDRGGLAWANGLSAFVRLQQGDLEGAREQSAVILRESLRRGDRFGEGMMYVIEAAVQLWTGHPRKAVESTDSALEALRSCGDVVGLEQALALAGRAEIMSGNIEAGRAYLGEALELTERTSTAFAEIVHYTTEVQLGFGDRIFAPGFGPAGEDLSGEDLAGEVRDTDGRVPGVLATDDLGRDTDRSAPGVLPTDDLGRDTDRSAPGVLATDDLGREDTPVARLLDESAPVEMAASSPFIAQHLATTALALTQSDRPQEALELARAIEERDANGYTMSSLALVVAAAGSLDEVCAAADAALAMPASTYLDRTIAHVAVALADPSPVGDAAMLSAVAEVSATEDVLSTTLVDLASEIRSELAGGPPAPSVGLAHRLDALCLGDTRWGDVFRRAASLALG